MSFWEDEEENWDTVEHFEREGETKLREPDTGIGEELRAGKASGKPQVLSIAEILAAEVLSSQRLLAVFLYLAERPRQAKELVSAKTYRIVSRKRSYGDSVEEIVAEKLPQSTMYRLLKRLQESGLVAAYQGIDHRKRYYRLTELGRQVLDEVLEMIVKYLRERTNDAEQYRLKDHKGCKALSRRDYEKMIAEKMGIDPELVRQLLGAKVVESSYSEYIVLCPKRATGKEKERDWR